MKKLLLFLAVAGFMVACGGSDKAQTVGDKAVAKIVEMYDLIEKAEKTDNEEEAFEIAAKVQELVKAYDEWVFEQMDQDKKAAAEISVALKEWGDKNKDKADKVHEVSSFYGETIWFNGK